jgi:hypothetical protein
LFHLDSPNIGSTVNGISRNSFADIFPSLKGKDGMTKRVLSSLLLSGTLLLAAPHAAFAEGRTARAHPRHCLVNRPGEHGRFGRHMNCHRP